ncbi:DUF4332 domain-containing protein [Marinivivus vitaminiproducens]|uniref:DUF4332 domain-containing protein n=1 Tax=Marinivivus vitaminiproducens TaxID=3035935 RepID=UPI0027A2A026|nr:DUF4332 domain-containing protein [Geminicoccaceae bacterium SCSIO 64248]
MTTQDDRAAAALPISKLRGVSYEVRLRLKRRGITRCEQLLKIAGAPARRAKLAEASGVDPEVLLALTKRADLARVRGVGAVFGMMLEMLDIDRVEQLAKADAATLHGQLQLLNQQERMARRAPTLEEVEDWLAQSNALPRLLTV